MLSISRNTVQRGVEWLCERRGDEREYIARWRLRAKRTMGACFGHVYRYWHLILYGSISVGEAYPYILSELRILILLVLL